MSWLPFIWLPVGYLIGSTPFGFLAGKLKGVDIRKHGSGNIGATNALRVLGKPIGITVFVMDFFKGVWPVFLANWTCDSVEPEGIVPVLTCLATILGHNFPVWLGFKGGKGIATSGGALLPLIPVTILVAIALWGITFISTRYVSLGSIVAALTLPTSIFLQGLFGNWQIPLLVLTAFIGGMAIYRHKSNIIRLLAGTEAKFDRKKKTREATS
tara:strand:- start:158 stop:796 length:639 start_codon:yes stop_codon:yes gene_type:complete